MCLQVLKQNKWNRRQNLPDTSFLKMFSWAHTYRKDYTDIIAGEEHHDTTPKVTLRSAGQKLRFSPPKTSDVQTGLERVLRSSTLNQRTTNESAVRLHILEPREQSQLTCCSFLVLTSVLWPFSGVSNLSTLTFSSSSVATLYGWPLIRRLSWQSSITETFATFTIWRRWWRWSSNTSY